MRVSTHPDILSRQLWKVEKSIGIRLPRATFEAIGLEKLFPGYVWRFVLPLAHLNQRVWLSVVYGQKSSVSVRDMKKGHVPERLELQQPLRLHGSSESELGC